MLECSKRIFTVACVSRNLTIVLTSQLSTKMVKADGSVGNFDSGARAMMTPSLGKSSAHNWAAKHAVSDLPTRFLLLTPVEGISGHDHPTVTNHRASLSRLFHKFEAYAWAEACLHGHSVVRLLSSPVTQGDEEMVREEGFKMVSGGIFHCASVERTKYGLRNEGGWKHGCCLILMGVAFRRSATAFNVWYKQVDYWGPGSRRSGLCNPCSNRALISLVLGAPAEAVH